jgi:REP element-mobilizing transposase RayT
MPRIARVIVPDVPYHITQRGNYRQDVFEHKTGTATVFIVNFVGFILARG